MLNYDGNVGAVGRIPWYMRRIIDHAHRAHSTSKAKRRSAAPTASASNVRAGEVGEAIGQIADEPGQSFEGYTQGSRHRERKS